MELTSSALASALRIGVNIVVGQKRPVLEFYQEVQNNQGPPVEFAQTGHRENGLPTLVHRFSDQFIGFTLVNIGSVRAENVMISHAGELKRDPPRDDLGGRFNNEHAQMPPGQSMWLFRLELFDLWEYPPEGGTAIGNKDQKLILTVDYNGPSEGMNRVRRWLSEIRGKKQYRTTFVFHTTAALGELPPVKYAS